MRGRRDGARCREGRRRVARRRRRRVVRHVVRLARRLHRRRAVRVASRQSGRRRIGRVVLGLRRAVDALRTERRGVHRRSSRDAGGRTGQRGCRRRHHHVRGRTVDLRKGARLLEVDVTVLNVLLFRGHPLRSIQPVQDDKTKHVEKG